MKSPRITCNFTQWLLFNLLLANSGSCSGIGTTGHIYTLKMKPLIMWNKSLLVFISADESRKEKLKKLRVIYVALSGLKRVGE